MSNSPKLNTPEAFLTFANLQMAAEAFWVDKNSNPREEFNIHTPGNPIDILKAGNDHASRFTETQAKEFAANWKVVAHIGNTTTGFSGTLFEAQRDIPEAGIKRGERVLSFRSTEFIEDAVHDNRATNTLEIKEKGFAFGQIADMGSRNQRAGISYQLRKQ